MASLSLLPKGRLLILTKNKPETILHKKAANGRLFYNYTRIISGFQDFVLS